MSYILISEQNNYQKNWIANRRKKWLSENGPCVECGSTQNLEVDHIDRATKVTHKIWSWSEERRLKELVKCQVLCYNCHKKKTIIQMTRPETHGSTTQYRKGCRCNLCKHVEVERVTRYRALNGRNLFR